MGDRANVILKYHTGTELYLYTHWDGWRWAETLREALEFGKSRWYDEPYLARIIISRMFAELYSETTGGGISPDPQDGYTAALVDLKRNTVLLKSSDKYSFTEFVALSNLEEK